MDNDWSWHDVWALADELTPRVALPAVDERQMYTERASENVEYTWNLIHSIPIAWYQSPGLLEIDYEELAHSLSRLIVNSRVSEVTESTS